MTTREHDARQFWNALWVCAAFWGVCVLVAVNFQ